MAEERWSGSDSGTQVIATDDIETSRPNLYRVILLNDDYTPMEFVVWLLQTVFHKPNAEAVRLMLDVHHKGKGLCGVYTHDVARTKVLQVKAIAEKHEHPLRCEMEVVEGP